ncbi:carbon starvation CstA family protein [Haloglycomyces albus]|uniref:carbon starvation CstA family protein n=1 Tax=Haloglycomyces albus TaxID=526067 RepID=UPI00046D2A45|nr:carbon starvation protein A [Haloglycomyces albus]
MPAFLLAIGVLSLFAAGFLIYSRYLSTAVFRLDDAYVTPAHRYRDGIDYVPTNKHVLFGHHFTSVAGAAPIIGPAIAVFWGWLPALIWVVVGTIVAAGVHDFGSLVLSVRHRARSIGTITKDVISPRAGTLFLLIVFFLITMVCAVFAVVIANLFLANPGSVIPIFGEIPIAMLIGAYIWRTRTPALIPSLLGVAALYLLIIVGHQYPVDLSPVAEAVGMQPRTAWILIILAYTFIASRLPIWLLMQPRDYINSHQLFIALAVVLLGVGVGWDRIVAPAINNVPDDSPSMWPFLFITIACGAISGFHCLVSSGTSSKQLDRETDARMVGYGGALGEGSLALCSILAVTAGIAGSRGEWEASYGSFTEAGAGAVGNFVSGIGHFAANLGLPEHYALIFGAVVVISFAATSLDTGVRLQRYVIQEISRQVGFKPLSNNLTLAGVLTVVLAAALALAPGGGDKGFALGVLWQLFGTTNQLLAGLALATLAVWLVKRNTNPWAILTPMVFLVAMTSWALVVNIQKYWEAAREQGAEATLWVLPPLAVVIFALAVWTMIEAASALGKAWGNRGSSPRTSDTEEPNVTLDSSRVRD